MQDSSAPHVHTQHTHNYSHHVPALACCSLIYNPNCYLGRLIGWSGAKQIQQRLNVRLDHMTWFLQETPLSSQTDHNMNFLTVKQYSKKVTTLMWCNDVQPHQRSVPDNSVTDSRALLCCRNTECQGWSKAVIFNRRWVMPQKALFPFRDATYPPAKCSHEQDRANNNDRASQGPVRHLAAKADSRESLKSKLTTIKCIEASTVHHRHALCWARTAVFFNILLWRPDCKTATLQPWQA